MSVPILPAIESLTSFDATFLFHRRNSVKTTSFEEPLKAQKDDDLYKKVGKWMDLWVICLFLVEKVAKFGGIHKLRRKARGRG